MGVALAIGFTPTAMNHLQLVRECTFFPVVDRWLLTGLEARVTEALLKVNMSVLVVSHLYCFCFV